MALNRFFAMFAAILFGSIVFGLIYEVLGPDNYGLGTVVVLALGMLVLAVRKEISELTFWLILTLAGKNFEDGPYLLFFAMVMAYIVISAKALSAQDRK